MLDQATRLDMVRLLVNFVNRDSPGLTRDFLSLGFLPASTPPQLVEAALDAVFDGAGPGKRRFDFQGALAELGAVLRAFKFNVPPKFALVIRALGALEGTVIKVARAAFLSPSCNGSWRLKRR